jgi:hypothetical protein
MHPSLMTSTLDGVEWSASRPGSFTPGESAPVTHWTGGCVDLPSGLDAEEKSKISYSYPVSIPSSLAVHSVTRRYSD